MCISLTKATACKYDIPIDTVSTQSTVIREFRVYPAEGPMPRASEAPFAPDIVRCSKSCTTVDAGRCSQCSPTNGHREEDTLLLRERSPGRRRLGRAVAESLPKNLIAAHPVQGSQEDEGSRGTFSPLLRARRGTGWRCESSSGQQQKGRVSGFSARVNQSTSTFSIEARERRFNELGHCHM